jgi:hypothetical protein
MDNLKKFEEKIEKFGDVFVRITILTVMGVGLLVFLKTSFQILIKF